MRLCALSVRRSIREHISKNTGPNIAKFPVRVTHCCDSVRLWRRRDIESTRGFVIRHVCTYWQEIVNAQTAYTQSDSTGAVWI